MVAYPARPDRRELAQKQGALRELIRARRDPHVFEDHLPRTSWIAEPDSRPGS